MRILVSACLLGAACRYDGGGKFYPEIAELACCHELFPVCPEQLGGLSTPRPPSERQGERVATATGEDVTAQFRRGAEETLALCRILGCQAAILKERSPSCGKGQIYDGTFTGTLTERWGVTAERLHDEGIGVYGESEISAFLEKGSE